MFSIGIQGEVLGQPGIGVLPRLKGHDPAAVVQGRGRHQGKIAHVGAHIPEDVVPGQETLHQVGFVALVVMPVEIDLQLFGVGQVQLHAEALVQADHDIAVRQACSPAWRRS